MINFKDFNNINNIEALVNAIEIPEISDTTNFWLIRAESGTFYDEYINNDFVALSWNDILPNHIESAKKDADEKKQLLNRISTQYDSKQPGMIFNKCNRFINEIKKNDIFMIPDKSNNELTFAFADEYYEKSDLNTTEAEFIAFKESGWTGTFKDKDCPYTKRRKIKILKKIPGKYINPNLFKALISYHGLSDINDYADDILSSIYPIYIYNNKLSTVFMVMAEDRIDALAYSSFIYNSSKQINASGDLTQITVKSNINSPGNIILNFIIKTKDIVTIILPYIAVIWICLGGGKVLGCEFNPIIKTISDAFNDKEERRKQRAESKSIEIDNENKEIDLETKKSFHNFLRNINPELLEEIASTSEPLNIDVSQLAQIINIEEYKKNKDS